MEIAEYTLPIRNLVDEAQTIHLFLPDNPDLDLVVATLSWRNNLKLREKNVVMAAQSLNQEALRHLPFINEIRTPLPQPEMKIKIDLRKASISRVNYQTVGDTLIFNLYPQNKPISRDQVAIEQSDLHSDLVFAMGFEDGQALNSYTTQNLINVDINPENSRFGRINMVNPRIYSLSELTAKMFSELNWPLETETTTLLLSGMIYKTSGFKEHTNEQTFETAALLTKANADVKLAHEYVQKALNPQ